MSACHSNQLCNRDQDEKETRRTERHEKYGSFRGQKVRKFFRLSADSHGCKSEHVERRKITIFLARVT